MAWVVGPLKQYATFAGRARRLEFWVFLIFVTIIQGAGNYYDRHLGNPEPVAAGMGLWTLVTTAIFLIPTVAVGVRRLHDSGRSGLWMLLGYGPMALANLPKEHDASFELVLAGGLVVGIGGLLAMMAIPGTGGPNPYGPDPRRQRL